MWLVWYLTYSPNEYNVDTLISKGLFKHEYDALSFSGLLETENRELRNRVNVTWVDEYRMVFENPKFEKVT